MDTSKEELKQFERFRIGDVANYEQLFHRYYQPLCLFALQFKIKKEEAEEIVQDVLLQLWNKKNDFQDIDKMRAFLYVSTRNATFNLLDKNKRQLRNRELFLTDISADAKGTALTAEQHQMIVYAEMVKSLHDGIMQLPEQCAKIMLMLYIDGLSVAEITEELQIAGSTVYAQKRKGISLLKTYLNPEDYVLISLLITGFFKNY